MSMLATKFWVEMTWRDFQAADMREVIAVLPVAAIEQHGPHLPVGVDAYIGEGYLARVIQRLPSEMPVLFLPAQSIGASLEHSGFPGALSASNATLIRLWTDIGQSVARAGCRKLVIINAHGGNSSAIDAVALELRARCQMLVVKASWSRFGYPDGIFSPQERAHGVHAGDIETSLMLAFRPGQVRMKAAQQFNSAGQAMERDFTWLRPNPPAGFGWMMHDLNPEGAVGDAAAASAAKGAASADYGATAFVELLRDVAAFDLARLGVGPLG